MGMKSILTPFMEESSARLSFQAASTLAREYKAHISAVHIRQRPLPSMTIVYPLGGIDSKFVEKYQESEEELADALRKIFDESCGAEKIEISEISGHSSHKGVTASWSDIEGDLFADMSRRAMTGDVAIIANPEDGNPVCANMAQELLFQSGRPVIICPAAGIASPPKRIVVAWNGRQEAARAVDASLDFLRDAEAVKVLNVRKKESAPVNTDAITQYLRLHGVDATQTEIEIDEDQSETSKLIEEIREFKTDLLVMGAYSHNRWREAILGGFTRQLINHPFTTVFMMQ